MMNKINDGKYDLKNRQTGVWVVGYKIGNNWQVGSTIGWTSARVDREFFIHDKWELLN